MDTVLASSGSLASETFDHPLSEPSLDSMNYIESPLSPDRSYEPELNHSSSKGKLVDRRQGGHGICLTTSDQDRIKIFMHELCVRALIPWTERQMKILNEQVQSKETSNYATVLIELKHTCKYSHFKSYFHITRI